MCINLKRATDMFLIMWKLTDKHAKLPSTLSSFSSFLLGEIFSQVRRLSVAVKCFVFKLNLKLRIFLRNPYHVFCTAEFYWYVHPFSGMIGVYDSPTELSIWYICDMCDRIKAVITLNKGKKNGWYIGWSFQ